MLRVGPERVSRPSGASWPGAANASAASDWAWPHASRRARACGFMNLRVADVQSCYEQWSSRGAEFVRPPIDRGAEIRCYMRDPDGYLIELGQATGLLDGRLAEKRPEDLPG
ncbi:MAG TPA: VOC family protein [Solirubrobacteraceae bacterium]|nr:VOC family protein [Solirubrobacteraceae bacterium]